MPYQSSEQIVNAFPRYPEAVVQASAHDQQGSFQKAIKLSAIVFTIVLLPLLLFTFLRPAIYLSEASLLIDKSSKPSETNLQTSHNLSIEKSVLLSQESRLSIIDGLRRSQLISAQSAMDVNQLSEMLSVNINGNNLLELQVKGEEKDLLYPIMELWIGNYGQRRLAMNENSTANLDNELGASIIELESKVEQKRAELVTFRELNNIESTQREENQIVARLKKITESLNIAQDERVNNEAQLSSLHASIQRGEPILLPADQTALARLGQRSMELREQIADIESQYTPALVAITPKLQAVYDNYQDIQRDINNSRQAALEQALTEAKNRIENSVSIINKLKKQRTELKQKASDFNSSFVKYTALEEELNQLSEILRQSKTQLAENESRSNASDVKVEILTMPSQPESPVSPLYTRDTLLSIAAASLLGLVVGLFYFVLMRPRSPLLVPHKQQIFYPVAGAGIVSNPGIEGSTVNHLNHHLNHAASISLPHFAQREVSEFELQSLLEVSDPLTQLLIYMMIAGNNPDEMSQLTWHDMLTNGGLIRLPEDFILHWPVENKLTQLVSKLSKSEDESHYVWSDSKAHPMDVNQLNTLISDAAHDAGLTEPQSFNLQVLHSSYLAFLARQGLRISSLSKLTDQITNESKETLSRLSPPGKKKSFAEINLLHPIIEC